MGGREKKKKQVANFKILARRGGEAQDKTTNNANQLQVMSSAGYETSSGRQKEERRRDKITKSQHKRENRGYCE